MFLFFFFFFFNDTATTEIYTLSLHDALPISSSTRRCSTIAPATRTSAWPRSIRSPRRSPPTRDRKSTRLNSSHGYISYAVFCLKKKKKTIISNSYCYRRDKLIIEHTLSSDYI